MNTGVNLALAQGIPEKVLAYYEGSRHWSLAAAIGLYVIGLILAAAGGLKVRSVIKRTKHE